MKSLSGMVLLAVNRPGKQGVSFPPRCAIRAGACAVNLQRGSRLS